MAAERASHRAGVVALLGRPNAGKSTLLNALLGRKLAIVSHRPQTTRSRILGILSRQDAQILLSDTPGLPPGGKPLDAVLTAIVEETADDCDVALLLVDPVAGFGPAHVALCERLEKRRCPVLVVATKSDLPAARSAAWLEGAPEAIRVSAHDGSGLEALVEAVIARLPEAPALYPEDELSDRPLRFLSAELVREAAFEVLEQELPYALAVEIVEFDESAPGAVRVRANLLVERSSQKQIVIGSGGSMIKRIGVGARREIEKLLETRVHLSLWVKVEPRWSKRPKRLKALGYC